MEGTFQPSAPRAPKRQRRQYQSCDNCRKGRRACNAVSLGINPLQPNSADASSCSAAIACSTCQRSNKECTFRWLQELPRGTLPECLKQKFSKRYDPVMHGAGVFQGSQPSSQSRFPYVSSSNETDNGRTNPTSGPVVRQKTGPGQARVAQRRDQPDSNHIEHQATGTSENDVDSAADIAVDCTNWLENIPYSASPLHRHPAQELWQSGTAHVAEEEAHLDDSGQSTTFASWDSPIYGSLLGYAPSNAEGIDYCVSDQDRHTSDPLGETGSIHQTKNTGELALFTDAMLEDIPPSAPQVADDVSFNMREFDLTQSFSKGLISDKLLSIYHDSFENSLSCWVTESNCPYKLPKLLLANPTQRQKLLSYLASTGFYQRIRRLDNAFSPLRKQPLSRGDCARASKALMLAILAFASQWTHSHDRQRHSRSIYSEADINEPHDAIGKSTPDTTGTGPHDFERLIQQSLWNEAADALHACFNIDSFELIFAQIIFAIMERPSARGKSDVSEHSRLVAHHGDLSPFSSLPAASVRDRAFPSSDRRRKVAVGNDRYLEIALRHLLAWKRRVSAARQHQTTRAQPALGNSSSLRQPALLEDYQAFDMFFWFGVMCDTTSAVLNERSPIIPDTDSVFSLDDGQMVSGPAGVDAPFARHGQLLRTTTSKGSVWGSCLTKAQPLFGAPAIRWPWSPGVAERLLQEAIPVKVLLWRRVTVIKALLAKETRPSAIERCINETLKVYEYWQQHYGDFMLDCISNHSQLPFKIQSWYVILASHWHLAGLLVAHYIDLVDVTLRSEPVQRSLRHSSALVLELQKANAYAIANLARVAVAKPPESGASRHSQSFHYALAYGALVTEPWPEVLNQALTKACEVLLGWLSSTKEPVIASSQQTWVAANTSAVELTRHATSCIEALTLLGSSSDLAQLMALSLEDKLQSLNRLPSPAFDVQWQDFGYDNLVY